MTVVGNFGIFSDQIDPEFQQTGKWYNYLTGDSITVANTHGLLNLNAGEYAVYTTTPHPPRGAGHPRQRGRSPAPCA